MDGQTDQADQIMQGETPRQEIQTQEQEPGGIEPLSGQPGSEAMEPPSENPGSEIPASENPGSLPDTPMADVELATEASEAAEAAGTPSAAKKSRTPRITSLNLPPPRDPSSRRSGAHLPGGLSFPPLDLPDYSDGSGTEVPKGNAGVQWVVQGPESPVRSSKQTTFESKTDVFCPCRYFVLDHLLFAAVRNIYSLNSFVRRVNFSSSASLLLNPLHALGLHGSLFRIISSFYHWPQLCC